MKAIVEHNERIARGYWRMGLSLGSSGGFSAVMPGQFVMLRISDSLDPLLRRPFGIYDVSSGGRGIEIFYKVVGKGTSIMSGFAAGHRVDVMGPLGNGFPEGKRGADILLVAGGMGIVPFYLLLKRSLEKGLNPRLLYGAKGRKEARFLEDVKRLGIKAEVTTEDGSVGTKGFVTQSLEYVLKPGTVLYACGPMGMLKEVATITREKGMRCFVSLENSMACGIGVCLGCAVKVKRHPVIKPIGYEMVCSDGPVFDSEDIEWEGF